ncbi:sodium transport system permease protein [Clostridium acetobutylicum]|uniref:Na+ ABC transporter, NATB n=1 Tax=Clostridium acetobutylicum (strain ATCC 824 / DSM 792 / JCM 1419 / IAM 19013 / LMG 5710 / NBRC 13948 / NRRL B-527 / VKM B-1787 / 2291 / W) TaxID=272562 RepID=Q97DC8_CLOAB|nr:MULTISPECIES: ABC transporter permease [Clostridium]AAK81475.1 Na+ ABC transporter, NATB [Clostridium acetobutylicum ATCC 824]ADZ22593.1 Na+ ABC transporter, NATB [Clostridium acetobutylicum EA 2018]AEI33865.1 Na+ ABC transporter, NATB [Clostridium acetobutylicum DSM 1731]AWV80852.1 ABC transporter permease [Clostridium acetobutylicum]MBC2393821.1 ABC transporter permease [Clostridium acetobutylicum]
MKNTTMIVFKKELKDIFRDRKTIIFSILIPMLLLPLISFFMSSVVNKSEKSVKENLKIAIVDKGNSSLGNYLRKQKNIKIVKSNNIKSDVKDGKILVAVTIPEDFDEYLKMDANTKITLTYDNSSTDAMTAYDIVNSYVDKYSKSIVAGRLAKRNINPEVLTPVKVNLNTTQKDNGTGAIMVTMLVPLLLMLYSATGVIGSSVDLGAGEKERGTLEPLLTTKASRLSILWGKILAISIVGIIISIASLIGLYITMKQKNGMFGNGTGFNLGAETMILVMILPIMSTIAFGAIELAISIYARSFKEAQTYLSPVTIIAMVLVYLVMMKDPKNIEMFYFNIPITNATCLIKEFLVGIHNYTHIAITFGWMIVYMVAALVFARYMFSREEVIFRS